MITIDLWVVVPFYNEAALILDTLEALSRQTDGEFKLVLVDNISTDNSPELVRAFMRTHPLQAVTLITEPQKGTGAASDTGFRYAINHGATHIARTDADAMPQADWVAIIKQHFYSGARIVGGKLKPRRDESSFRWIDGQVLPILIRISEIAPYYIHHRPSHKYRLFMIPGLNMAIESSLYLEVGGFGRTSIDDTDEDLVLHMKVCDVIEPSQAHFAKDMVVFGSIRKVKAFGYVGIMLWYWDRKFRPKTVDVR